MTDNHESPVTSLSRGVTSFRSANDAGVVFLAAEKQQRPKVSKLSYNLSRKGAALKPTSSLPYCKGCIQNYNSVDLPRNDQIFVFKKDYR